ncbi:protoporphyrinogen oxidase [Phycicoccus endophyticus]|uniref:Coproporphyrinogen III oxidase n=1 Tax=Phycicoccus endophyticus TaxID=1690220 RepID=A0A7G9R4T2_9MICO|nr:protoporphyrinogen oxidase [Phycicoccus endophyticus]NHI18525.1 protoporphyrinogen oxidase [Phycicoccus endophyticus]QNN50607.1 protoporphyrinogen oxidase [Phycicoccus endophyticus]GGL23086.1 protoporphyrinogen oxidase [Phycicoccus endophyticus]
MPADSLPTRPHVAVVGGGIAGLAAALEVLDAVPGAHVTVLEAGDRFGGKLRLEPVAGHRVDVGAESLLAVRPEAVDLARRAGLEEDDLVTPATTSAQVWSRGALHPLPTGTVMGVPTDPPAARGLLDDAEVARATDEQPWPGERVETDVSVGQYVGHRMGRAVVDRLVEPLLGGVYAGHADRLSLQATVPALWQRAVRGESLRTPPAARPPAPGGSAPRSPFAGIRGGVGRLPGLVEDELRTRGALLRTDAVVRVLERAGERWRLVVGSAAHPATVEADAVVLAVPATPAARLLAELAPLAARSLGQVETASMAVVTLAVRRDGLPDLPGSGFLVPPVDGHGVKAATFSFAKWGWVGALSPEVVHLRASLGRAGEEAALQRDDAELVTLAVAEVGEALGAPLPPVVDHHVQRWGGGLPQYAVGHLGRVAAVRSDLARLPGVEVAGAVYDGVGIPAVIASATRAARAVAEHVTSAAGVAATTIASEGESG